MKDPLITVLMPVFNAEAFLAEAIQSILSQTFSDFELLIINDGSTDDSEKIIRSFQDQRLRLVNNEKNLKLIATLNKGIDLSRGKYIARMDADDISAPQRLQKQAEFMEMHHEIGVCGSWFTSFGKGRKAVKYPADDDDIRLMLLYQTPFCHPCVMIRKKILDENNIRFSTDFIHAEDLEFWVRLMEFTKFANLQESLLEYRVHEKGVSNAHKDIQEKNTSRILKLMFEKVGAEVSNDEIKLFREVVYGNFKKDKTYIENAESIFLKVLIGNKKTKVLSQKKLENFLGEKWFHLCYNTTSLGPWIFQKFQSSRISKCVQTGLSTKFWFLLKTVGKK